MKIGFYNAWSHTMGGGEKYSLTIAAHLSKIEGNEVEILTPYPLDKESLEKRLDLDLSRIKIKYLKSNDERLIEPITKEYDFFINASYTSSLVNHADKSLLFVYFPTKLDVGLNILQKIVVFLFGSWAKRFCSTSNIVYEEGFYPIEKSFFKYFRWTNDYSSVILKKLESDCLKVKISSSRPSTINQAKIKFTINGEFKSPLFKIPRKDSHLIKLNLPSHLIGQDIKLNISCNTFNPFKNKIGDDPRELGIMVYWISDSLPKLKSLKKIIQQQIPPLLIDFPKLEKFTSSYDDIVTISKYTQKWIKKLWKKNSNVFYPYVDTEIFKPAKKENIILNVGRFFKVGHNKKQLECIRTFKQMINEGLQNWQLILVGGVQKNRLDQLYFKQCLKEAAGYPIRIEKDMPFQELIKLYGQAKIFWHAAGYKENEKRHPDKFEHFGITTIEAMSAGCVPVVIGKAGQIEIVEQEKNGFLWHNLMDLKKQTYKLIDNEELLQELSRESICTAQKFNREKFNQNLDKILKGFLQ